MSGSDLNVIAGECQKLDLQSSEQARRRTAIIGSGKGSPSSPRTRVSAKNHPNGILTPSGPSLPHVLQQTVGVLREVCLRRPLMIFLRRSPSQVPIEQPEDERDAVEHNGAREARGNR